MRFRKSINIMKGVKMNLSKSGASYTIGGKGLSVNVGKNGVYLNMGLPGTGIYDRKKLFGGKSTSKRSTQSKKAAEIDVRNFELELTEEGKIAIYNKSGSRASEEEARLIKRTDWYDDQADALMQELKERMNAESEAFVNIYRNAQKVTPPIDPQDDETVEAQLDEWLNDLELPVDFDVQYEYHAENGSILVDLDLPEIDDLPEEKAVEMASGEIKSKAKTMKELKEEYRTCVCGLAVFFASHIFLNCPGIRTALVSGYTQRRDTRTSEREDCYVYSIAFEREAFQSTACSREDPYDFTEQFRSRINVSSTGEMKQIVPYTAEEFAEICADLDD